jgi:hypothetical protein
MRATLRSADGEAARPREAVTRKPGLSVVLMALAAQPKSRFGHLRWRVLAGPNIPDDGLQRFPEAAG